MKTIIKILFTLAFMLILLISYTLRVYAHSNNNYSIDIPEGYKRDGNNSWMKYSDSGEELVAIRVNIDQLDQDASNIEYTNDILDNYASILKTSLSSEFQDLTIQRKAITGLSNNNYKCYFVKCRQTTLYIKNLYSEMFLLFSGDKAYSLVFATYDKNYFNTTEYKNIRNSFTIKNFSGQYYSYTNTIILIVVLSIGSILLIVAIISLFLKKKKKTLNTVNIDNMQYYQYYNDNQNNNYKF